jgi:hypothetical protein
MPWQAIGGLNDNIWRIYCVTDPKPVGHPIEIGLPTGFFRALYLHPAITFMRNGIENTIVVSSTEHEILTRRSNGVRES